MHRIKNSLKHYVDENAAQKCVERKDTKQLIAGTTTRQVLAEVKPNTNISLVQQKALKEEPQTSREQKKAFSFKFGGGTTLMSVDCADDIDKYMRYLEGRNKLPAKFLSLQSSVDGRMRQILVDWLVHVQVRFALNTESLSLTVHILDRSLVSLPGINKQNLQLLGVTCLFIASKFEEIFVPSIEDLVYVAANVFAKDDILTMEKKVLQALNFDLSHPPAIHFLRRYKFYIIPQRQVWSLAKFISEVALVSYPLVHHPPSVVAAVSLYLASYTFGSLLTSKQLFAEVFMMDQIELIQVARSFVDHVLQFLDAAEKLFALRQKYHEMVESINDEHLNRLREFGDNLI